MSKSILGTARGVATRRRASDGGVVVGAGSGGRRAWAAMAAAVHRTRGGRAPWRPDQALDAATALAASTAGGSHTGNTLAPGSVADIVLVDRDPLRADDASLRATIAHATMIAGRLTHVGG